MPRVIRVSEVGEYVYCRRAWWLGRLQGEASANVRELAAGTGAHARHGRAVAAAGCLRLAAYLSLAVAIASFGLWLAGLGGQ